MKPTLSARQCLALLMAGLGVAPASTWAQGSLTNATWELADSRVRAAVVERLRDDAERAKAIAWRSAAREGWPARGEFAGIFYELQEIRSGRLLILRTENVNAAISTAANLVRNTAPYNVNGAGHTAGEWDGGAPRTTHQELTGRITVKDGAATADHASHVAGTIIAAGVDAAALGMAPGGRIDAYEWTSDTSEMLSRGMTTSGESNKLTLSNHSYGYVSGWETGTYSGNSGPHWFGLWGNLESDNFGQYDSTAQYWDYICAVAPYYLPFKSAGNDRNDAAPGVGTTFYYYNGGWQSKSYVAGTDPPGDGWDNGGFDSIPLNGVSKNIMTVGAVADAVSGGARSLANATITAFSGWGPTDDGRIKPDIVANGASLYSSVGSGNAAYANFSGTSMSTPNACGSGLLLVDYYNDVFPGQYMSASTLKGLIIHTADDLGNSGPDYTFGWGLMNTKAAADHIHFHQANPGALRISESFVTAATSVRTNIFLWDGVSPIRATLCWTDPYGTAQTTLDNPTRNLVNNLDLSLVNPAGQTNLPYVLAPTNPALPATTGTNDLDNVEQVYVASPGVVGLYSAIVRLRGALTGTNQTYSLLLSGSLPASYTLTVTGTPANLGAVSPPYGTNLLLWGSAVTGLSSALAMATNNTSLTTYVADGWTGTGSVPAVGNATNTGAFTLTTNSALTWRWRVKDLIVSNQTVAVPTNFTARDTITAQSGFTVVPPGNVTFEAGSSIQLDPGFTVTTGAVFRATVTNE